MERSPIEDPQHYNSEVPSYNTPNTSESNILRQVHAAYQRVERYSHSRHIEATQQGDAQGPWDPRSYKKALEEWSASIRHLHEADAPTYEVYTDFNRYADMPYRLLYEQAENACDRVEALSLSIYLQQILPEQSREPWDHELYEEAVEQWEALVKERRDAVGKRFPGMMASLYDYSYREENPRWVDKHMQLREAEQMLLGSAEGESDDLYHKAQDLFNALLIELNEFENVYYSALADRIPQWRDRYQARATRSDRSLNVPDTIHLVIPKEQRREGARVNSLPRRIGNTLLHFLRIGKSQ